MKCSFCLGNEATHFIIAKPRQIAYTNNSFNISSFNMALCEGCVNAVPVLGEFAAPDKDWKYEVMTKEEAAIMEVMES